MSRYFYSILFSLLAIVPLQAQMQTIDDGPIHEAFVQPVYDELMIEAIPTQPPETITEKIPQQVDPASEWINGYWYWSADRKDFIWIGGAWRRPPPGMEWIPGNWKQFQEGWAWIKGFWSSVPEDKLVYIDEIPPDPIEEDASNPPADGYFWARGYWSYDTNQSKYVWIGGRWEPFDSNWMYIPAHYVWRPGGYVFIKAYWDWLLDARGRLYAPVYVPPSERINVIYNPVIVIEPLVIIRRIFLCYPDYVYFCHHNYHFHPEYWEDFGYIPTWWGWNSWWSLTWHHHWGLWWWCTHPGYPQPLWLSADYSRRIAAPSQQFLNHAKRIRAPLIVTPKGVVPPSAFLNAISKTSNKNLKNVAKQGPVVKLDSKLMNQINQKITSEKLVPKEILKPTGPKISTKDMLIDKKKNIEVSKPNFPNLLKQEKVEKSPSQIKMPSIPTEKVEKPKSNIPINRENLPNLPKVQDLQKNKSIDKNQLPHLPQIPVERQQQQLKRVENPNIMPQVYPSGHRDNLRNIPEIQPQLQPPTGRKHQLERIESPNVMPQVYPSGHRDNLRNIPEIKPQLPSSIERQQQFQRIETPIIPSQPHPINQPQLTPPPQRIQEIERPHTPNPVHNQPSPNQQMIRQQQMELIKERKQDRDRN